MTTPCLRVENLNVMYNVGRQRLHAVKDVSIEIAPGETLGLVGESGSGKSTTGLAILRLIEAASGEIMLGDSDVARAGRGELKALRKRMQMVFQDPYSSLNPSMTVEQLLSEPLIIHADMTQAERRSAVGQMLQSVGLHTGYASRYPHEFSGGQRQRVVIALALCAEPSLVIADEPTTALDVSIQAQIITLLKDLTRDHGTAVMLVTHDMGVIAETADRVAVMYAGRIVEIGPVGAVIREPAHPYTDGLMASIPSLEHRVNRLRQIDGAMPRLDAIPPGCRFHPRCPRVFDRCSQAQPELMAAGATQAACWLHDHG
jgi:peptide/nickel transport system ATP-binding protein